MHRITIVPVSDEEADIVVFTKDVYSLGGSFTYRGIDKGSVSVFDKNIFGIGHELGIDMPYDSRQNQILRDLEFIILLITSRRHL